MSDLTPGQQALTIQQALDLGFQHHNAGRLAEAEGIYQQILQADPNHPIALHLLGVIAHQVGKNDIAVDLITKAVAIKPDYAEAYSNRGLALHYLGQFDEAVASYRKALVVAPHYADAWNNLAITLQDLGQIDEAVEHFHKALAIKADFAEVHNNLGNIFHKLFRLDEAVEHYRQAIAIKPDYPAAHSNLGNALKDLGRLDEAVASFRRALAIQPDHAAARSNLIFTLLFIPDISSTEILKEARLWEAHYSFKGEIHKHHNSIDPDRRLRVGLLSGDLWNHPISSFLEGVLSEIDKDKLELFVYATIPYEDDVTARLKSIVPYWRQASGRSDQQLADDIAADGIDILVDLSGHTAQNRLAVFCRKPAPIQVTWLGYGGTTGVDGMDYILCDPVILPAAEEAHYTEMPWRLPDIWMCFTPSSLDIDAGPPPALQNGYVTFGSFNSLTKVSDQTVVCWARTLEAVPNSRLVLKARQLGDTTVRERILSRFELRGIDRHRLTLKSQIPSAAEHFRAYQGIDIALDPFPYGGGTTTAEALWMGAPVLTLKGDRYVSHMGESLVHNAGLDPWIADTPEYYVEKAKAFSADLPGLAALRASLRGQLLGSPVCDAARFAGNLEDALRSMWRQWCAKRSS